MGDPNDPANRPCWALYSIIYARRINRSVFPTTTDLIKKGWGFIDPCKGEDRPHAND
jgi:hypothetical protein